MALVLAAAKGMCLRYYTKLSFTAEVGRETEIIW